MLKGLSRVTLCAPGAARLRSKEMGPGALRRNGALFRGRRNFWDVADDKSEPRALGLHEPAPQIFVSDVRNALPPWHIER
jgi:hypothetical protein